MIINAKTILAIGAAAAAAIYIAKKYLKPKKHTATVQQKTWSEEVQVQKYDETAGSGWSVPDGAFDIKTERRLKRVAIPKFAGSRGDSVGDILDDYLAEATSSYSYQTWYTYKICKWVDSRVKRASGSDGTPHIDVEIEKPYTGEGVPEIGMERRLCPEIRFNILCVDTETGEFVPLDVDKTEYNAVKVGDTITYKKGLFRKEFIGFDMTTPETAEVERHAEGLLEEGEAMDPAEDTES